MSYGGLDCTLILINKICISNCFACFLTAQKTGKEIEPESN